MNDDSNAALAFLDEITPRVQRAVKAEEDRRRYQGTGFSIAEYAVCGYEVRLNRIISDLLEPRGPHGQGDRFLQLFLNLFTPDLLVGEARDWNIRLNHPTAKGRYVDIAMFRTNEIAIYIESKPWAGESDEQLEDYAYDLLSLTCSHKRLLFLPGILDREPQTLSQHTLQLLGKQFVRVPFQHSEAAPSIVNWLEQCAHACEADNVRVFIRDLSDYLRGQFFRSEATFMGEDQFLTEMLPIVRASKSYMATVFKVVQLADELKQTVTMSFLRELESKLSTLKSGWIVKNDFKSINSGEQHLLFRAQCWPEEWAICLEMWKPALQEFCIGFRCPSEVSNPNVSTAATESDRLMLRGALEQPLRAISNIQRMLPLWPAWCWLPAPFRQWQEKTFLAISGLEAMPDGRTALDTFVGWFQSIAKAVESPMGEIQLARNRGTSA